MSRKSLLTLIYAAIVFAAVLIIMTACTESGRAAPKIENVAGKGDGKYTFTFDSLEHDMILDLPEKPEGSPLVVMLHGQGNTAESFRSAVHFEESANPRGYAVVYVTAAADPEQPSYGIGWNSGLTDGKNRDVELLKAVTDYLIDGYGFDKKRVFAAGFSNGAFMTHRLAMEADGTFAAVASVAGFMTEYVWNERKEKNHIGVFQITGQKDEVVPKTSDKSASHSNAPAIEDVMDYWVSSNGLQKTEEIKIGKKDSPLTKYAGTGSGPQVWDLFVIDGRHSWPDEKINGIDTNDLILDFFDACTKNMDRGSYLLFFCRNYK
ncbi:MAG: prolyl oligopeptidase family serine peptidase [Lachnospiraceae bacterium]|nr:prolyl oligopeptidase family serine peptidase [Lachnospiraceae bacterium]